MDRRLTPANGRVAAAHLKGQVEAERFVKPVPRQLAVPLADLLSAPHGRRERQLQLGDALHQFEEREGWSFVQSLKDGYVGYLRTSQTDERAAPTHWVTAAASHLYPEAEFKMHERGLLSLGARVRVTGEVGRFLETEDGYVPRAHLAPLGWHFSDPVAVAALLLGTAYLWGGNSRSGIDCSGLVQAACLACGIPCPADSDMQSAEVGVPLAEGDGLRRGDLVFWRGHVAMVVDPQTLLHANAYHMAVAYEPLKEAVARIGAQGDGVVTARRRLIRSAKGAL